MTKVEKAIEILKAAQVALAELKGTLPGYVLFLAGLGIPTVIAALERLVKK